MRINVVYTSEGKASKKDNLISVSFSKDELYSMKRNHPNTHAIIDAHLKDGTFSKEDLLILLEYFN